MKKTSNVSNLVEIIKETFGYFMWASHNTHVVLTYKFCSIYQRGLIWSTSVLKNVLNVIVVTLISCYL